MTVKVNYASLAFGRPAPISVFAAGRAWGDQKMMHWLYVALIGLLAGWIAGMVVNRHHGLLMNLVIGLVGALIGSWLNDNVLHFSMAGISPFLASLLIATVGAIILLLILSLFRRRV